MQRRKPRSVGRRIAEFFWPSQGYRRSARYLLYRVKRLPATPHAIAAGFASGAAASFMPAIGLHFLMSFGLAWVVRGNMIAAALGTAVGNPLTFPIIYSTAYRLGKQILSYGDVPVPDDEDFNVELESELLLQEGVTLGTLEHLLPMLKVTAVGALPMGMIAFGVFYAVIYKFAHRFQEARRQRRLNHPRNLRPVEQG